MHFELRVAVAAILEAQSLELVITLTQVDIVSLNMAPEVARGAVSTSNLSKKFYKAQATADCLCTYCCAPSTPMKLPMP